jgi:predicted nucleic acid-binding protein
MILIDTSAWVEFDRATGSAVDKRVTQLISTAAPIAVSEPILMEILAGAKDETRRRDLRRLLVSFSWIPADAVADFEGAASIYRSCRAAGCTPRGLIDCMIVNICLRT